MDWKTILSEVSFERKKKKKNTKNVLFQTFLKICFLMVILFVQLMFCSVSEYVKCLSDYKQRSLRSDQTGTSTAEARDTPF